MEFLGAGMRPRHSGIIYANINFMEKGKWIFLEAGGGSGNIPGIF